MPSPPLWPFYDLPVSLDFASFFFFWALFLWLFGSFVPLVPLCLVLFVGEAGVFLCL
jgi:hypothetical protein